MRDIQLVLERWGAWSKYRFEMDYSTIAAGFKNLLPQNGGLIMCTDSDAMIIDSCVGKLKQKKPEEYSLIVDYYVIGLSKRKIAKKHFCDEKLIRIKIKMAEGFIDGSLSMLDVDLEMD